MQTTSTQVKVISHSVPALPPGHMLKIILKDSLQDAIDFEKDQGVTFFSDDPQLRQLIHDLLGMKSQSCQFPGCNCTQ